MPDSGDHAIKAANAIATCDKSLAEELFQEAVELHVKLHGDSEAADHEVRMDFIQVFAQRAGTSRRNGNDRLTNRLIAATYSYKPPRLKREDVRKLLVEAGAAGYIPQESAPRIRWSMVELAKG